MGWKKVLTLVSATILALVVAEIVVRWVFPPPAMWRIQPADGSPPPDGRSDVVIPNHPAQGGLFEVRGVHKRLRPNADVVIVEHSLSRRRVTISTNDLGLRHPPLGPDRGRRMLFLGDSVTLADYLPDDETFVRRVEERAHAEGRRWECINAGVGAIGTDSEVALYFEVEPVVQPEVVILNLYLNDFADSLAWSNPLPRWMRRSVLVDYTSALVLQTATLVADDDPAVRLLPRWRKQLEASWTAPDRLAPPLAAVAMENLRDWGGAWSPEAWQLIRGSLTTLADHCRIEGRTLVIAVHPVRHQVVAADLDDTPQRLARTLAGDLEVPLIDLLPVLRKARRAGAEPLFFDQCHHTERGAAVVGAALYESLAGMEFGGP
jgi:hypothetical protein